jgi:hypothetical protein
MPVNKVRFGERPSYSRGQRMQAVGGDTRGSDSELVAAESGDGVLRSHLCAESVCGGQQYLVAGGVSIGVIDRLERVQVDIQHTDITARRTTGGQRERGGEPGGEQDAVRQAGERVVSGLMGQCLLGRLASADVDVGTRPRGSLARQAG